MQQSENMKCTLKNISFLAMFVLFGQGAAAQTKMSLLNTNQLREYTRYFNSLDSEDVKNYVSNAKTFEWLSNNVPLFECPDSTIQKIYYYRWWTFRKHLKETPAGFIPSGLMNRLFRRAAYSLLRDQPVQGKLLFSMQLLLLFTVVYIVITGTFLKV